MKFSKTILAIAALFAISTITPAAFQARAKQITPEQMKKALALQKLQNYVNGLSGQLKRQLANPNERELALGALIIEAQVYGIAKEDVKDTVIFILENVLKPNAKDMEESKKLLMSMLA